MNSFKRDGLKIIRDNTGLVTVDPYFSGTKVKWILTIGCPRERAKRGELLPGTVIPAYLEDDAGAASTLMDYTNASRTMLFNIHDLTGTIKCWTCWIPRAMPPRT